MLITETSALVEFCSTLKDAPYLALDTEFLRERTYRAELCLVQVAHGEHVAAIDALAPGLDLSSLAELLRDRSKIKVLHSATQDLEIFLYAMGEVPGPVFDTQIAAAVCGHGEQPGYASLVASLLDVQLDKASQAVDWSLRPLSARQLEYALGDVTHLCRIYEILVAELERSGRSEWVSEEMAALLDPSRYLVDPRETYRRIKIRRPSRRDLAVLRELSAWREETAIERNLPRNWVVRDDALMEIAQHLPKDEEGLARVRGLKPQVARGLDGRAMLAAIESALAAPEETWPTAGAGRPILTGHEPMVALLQTLLKLRCDAHDVSTTIVAKRDDIERIATEDAPDVAALSGWRRRVFGAAALELRDGRRALTGDGRVVLEIERA